MLLTTILKKMFCLHENKKKKKKTEMSLIMGTFFCHSIVNRDSVADGFANRTEVWRWRRMLHSGPPMERLDCPSLTKNRLLPMMYRCLGVALLEADLSPQRSRIVLVMEVVGGGICRGALLQ